MTSASKLLSIVLAAALLPGLARAQAGSSPAVVIDSPADFYSSLSLHDAGGGWPHASGGGHPAMLPAGVLRLPPEEKYLLWVELEEGRLHLLEQQGDGGLLTRRIVPVSIGKNGIGKEVEGDKRTPVGVYRITSFLADGQLIDFYGLGAWPLNYPNPLDRRENRTGSGIWLHGLPKDVRQRPFYDSDGCVVIDNESLRELAPFISSGTTPVILSDAPLEWQARSATQARRQSLEAAIEQWRLAWERIDNEAYLGFYAEDFSDLNRDRRAWAEYKTRVNDAKTSIQVEVSRLSLLADPRDPELVAVRYYQDYRSSNYDWTGWKEQLWRLDESGWKILYEGNG